MGPIYRNIEFAKVIKLKLLYGDGTENDVCREVSRYLDLDGNLIAEIDPIKKTENYYRRKILDHIYNETDIEFLEQLVSFCASKIDEIKAIKHCYETKEKEQN